MEIGRDQVAFVADAGGEDRGFGIIEYDAVQGFWSSQLVLYRLPRQSPNGSIWLSRKLL